MPAQIDLHSQYEGYGWNAESAHELITKVLASEALIIKSFSAILVDDPYLRSLHCEFLDDDSVTDIMTFNLGSDQEIEAEVYISVDCARNNATAYGDDLDHEIARLVVHGILHLAGFEDNTELARSAMSAREDTHLSHHYRATQPVISALTL